MSSVFSNSDWSLLRYNLFSRSHSVCITMNGSSTAFSVLTWLPSTDHDEHGHEEDDHHNDLHSHGHSHDLNDDNIQKSAAEVAIAVFFLSSVSVFGTVLNTLLISAILLTRKLRTAAGLVIVSVSVNDLFLCLFVYPILAYGNIEGKMEYSEKWCTVSAACLQICTYVRICEFPIVAYKRQRSLTRRGPDNGRKTLVFMMVMSWIVPICVIVLPLLNFENVHIEYSRTYDACIIHDLLEYFSEVQFCLFILCFFVTCVLYVKILKHLKFEVVPRDREALPTMFQIQKRKIRTQFNRMMALVSAGFFICVFPYLCFRMADKHLDLMPYIAHKISLIMLVFCSLFNPVTLIFSNKWHRLVIQNMLSLKSPNKVIPLNVNIP